MIELDAFDSSLALGVEGALAEFNAAGVLVAADVHVALRLGRFLEEDDEDVLLAAALAVRAPRLGHVFVDLASIASTAAVEGEVDISSLPWPGDGWVEAVADSPLVTVGEDPEESTPLRLVGTNLYLDRYWREEVQLAADFGAFSAAAACDEAVLADGVARLFAEDDAQARAAATAVRRQFTVVAGGPGTGKTTTVARILALLLEQGGSPLIALAAPTGKAAARLEEAVHSEAASLDTPTRDVLLELRASTLHRLLGWRPGSHSRFRHDRGNRLPHDVVIVDETSMVSLSLMGRLVEAVRPEARLVLVGDPDQLTSIEAGAVLGDVVGPASAQAPIGESIVVLDKVHRFGGSIAPLARAIRSGDADEVLSVLGSGAEDVLWLDGDVTEAGDLKPVREAAVKAGSRVVEAATAGASAEALTALSSFRVLCAHRRGPHGAYTSMSTIERWLTDAIPAFDPRGDWYVGRPLLVTENDYSLKLYNGDTGVVISAGEDAVTAAFERGGGVVTFSPTRLSAVDTVYAMTIHKSQGSQFETAAVLLPPSDSPLLTRELFYTAATRASERLIVAGTEEAIRRAVERPAARASALRGRLWGAE